MNIILSNEHQTLVASVARLFVRLLTREQKLIFIDHNFMFVALKVFSDVGKWEPVLAVVDRKRAQTQM